MTMSIFALPHHEAELYNVGKDCLSLAQIVAHNVVGSKSGMMRLIDDH